MSENAKEWIKDIIVALVIGLIIVQFVRPTVVKEHSMEGTLHENDYIFLNLQAYRFGEPKAGDIIVFHSDLKTPAGKEKLLIKRIIGLPGDTISVSGGVVYRNGVALEEPYTLEGYTNGEMEETTVPEDYIFVMGDNRQNSIDSRDPSVGCVPMDRVMGKAFFRLFPFNSIGTLG